MAKAGKELNQFGKLLMKEVRDDVIYNYNAIIEGNLGSEESKYIQKIVEQGNINKEDLEKIVTEMIDRTIFSFLWFFEMNEEFAIVTNTGKTTKNVVELSDGLSGEMLSDEGWIKKYSEYKQLDDWMKEK